MASSGEDSPPPSPPPRSPVTNVTMVGGRRAKLSSKRRSTVRRKDSSTNAPASHWVTTGEIDIDEAISATNINNNMNAPPKIPPKSDAVLERANQRRSEHDDAKERLGRSKSAPKPILKETLSVSALLPPPSSAPPVELPRQQKKRSSASWKVQYLYIAATGTPITHPLSRLAPVIRRQSEGVGNLIARRKHYFTQLSTETSGANAANVGYEEMQDIQQQQGFKKKKSLWTSYSDLTSSDPDKVHLRSKNKKHPPSDGNGPFLPRSMTSECITATTTPHNQASPELLASVNSSLAHTDTLLSRRRQPDENDEEQLLERDLEELTRRQQMISPALQEPRKSREIEDQNSKLHKPASRHSRRSRQESSDEEEPEENAHVNGEAEAEDENDFRLYSGRGSSSGFGSQSPVSGVKSSISFNLFRDKTSPTSSIRSNDDAIGRKAVVSEDVGYLSDSEGSLSQVASRVRRVFIDSFGKGGNRKKPAAKVRPVVETPWIPKSSTEPNLSRTGGSMDSTRHSTISSSSGGSNESGASAVFDSNENELLSPEERQAKKVFKIAEEIMTSEEDFVNVLRLINIDFREFVELGMKEARASGSGEVIPDREFQRLFSNLLELQILNADLLKDFQVRVENWQDNKTIADIIVKKGAFLKLYTSYIEDFPEVSALFMECCEKYAVFGDLVREFEMQEKCRRLKISHFMLKPVQRLPQYRLLLEQYLKNLSVTSEDYENARKALEIVSKAAMHANDKMRQTDNFKRLLSLQNRMSEDLVQANRELVKEGVLQKISRSGVDLRYLILCNDCLVYAKFSGGLGPAETATAPLNMRYRIPLTHLTVEVPQAGGDEFPLDFNIISSVRSCALRAATVAERDAWVRAINEAIDDHRERRATFSHAASFDVDKAGKLGESAPVWVPDERVTMCQKCHYDFNLLVRRHHCRACGQVVCYYCSGNKAPLKYRGYEASRVCDTCYDDLVKVMEFDDVLRSYEVRFRRDEKSKVSQRNVPRRLQLRANDTGAQFSGYLHKRSSKSGKWKRHWFVLKECVLYEYKACEDAVAFQTYPILGYDLGYDEEIPVELSYIHAKGKSFRLTHIGSEPLLFFAETGQTASKWMNLLLEAVSF